MEWLNQKIVDTCSGFPMDAVVFLWMLWFAFQCYAFSFRCHHLNFLSSTDLKSDYKVDVTGSLPQIWHQHLSV